MSGYIIDMEEMTTPPSKTKEYSGRGPRRDLYDEGSIEPFLPRPAPIGFIYPPPSEQSSDNPYMTQAAYNPSYKPISNDVGYSTTENNERNKNEEEDVSAESKDTCVETCVTYCIIGIVILVIISVIAAIVYFLILHPKLARAIHEAVNAHADKDDVTTPLIRIMTVTNEQAKIANKSLTTT